MSTVQKFSVPVDEVLNREGKESTSKYRLKRRRVYYLECAKRPLFVAEASFKPDHGSRTDALVLLSGNTLTVWEPPASSGVDPDPSSHRSANDWVNIVRLVQFNDILDVRATADGGLRLEHHQLDEHIKLSLSALSRSGFTSAPPPFPGSGAGSSTAPPPGSGSSVGAGSRGGADAVDGGSDDDGGSQGSCAGGGPGEAKAKLTWDYFTLWFRSVEELEKAASLIIYLRYQAHLGSRWLNLGLPCSFAFQLWSVTLLHALPGGAATDPSAPVCQRWLPTGGGGLVWGSVLDLPAEWGAVLNGGAAGGSIGDTSGLTPCAVGGSSRGCADGAGGVQRSSGSLVAPSAADWQLPLEGLAPAAPAALQVLLSTPLGVAAAHITPRHIQALLADSGAHQVLAVPVQAGAAGAAEAAEAGAAPAAGADVTCAPAGSAFVSEIVSALAVEGSGDGGGGGGSSGGGSSRHRRWFGGGSSWSLLSGGPLAAGQGGLRQLAHRQEVVVALNIELVRAGAGAGSGPGAETAAAAAAASGGGVKQPAGDDTARTGAEAAAGGSDGGRGGLGGMSADLLRLSVLGSLVALSLAQLAQQPGLAVAQLALLGAASWLTWRSAAPAAKAAPAPAPAAPSTAASTAAGDCSWGVRLLGAELVTSPNQYLQLQLAAASSSCDAQMLQAQASLARARSLRLPASELGAPLLVADPEPAWLTDDIKERFLRGKPTLDLARTAALQTHEWRQQSGIDAILHRPAPFFDYCRVPFGCALLRARNSNGHSVMYLHIGQLGRLCDAIFRPSDGKAHSPEELALHLALLNEYIYGRVNTTAYPAGQGVQVYDVQGLRLRDCTSSEVVTLFQVLAKMGAYYPERLNAAIVINAPSWFQVPWKLATNFLDANTCAKVTVVSDPRDALPRLEAALDGRANVPAAWGGGCSLPLQSYPDNAELLDYVAQLNASQVPAEAPGQSG